MYIRVHVIPESGEEGIVEDSQNVFTVHAHEKAERGMANRGVLALLIRHFGAGTRLRIVSGHHSPHKIVSVEYNR